MTARPRVVIVPGNGCGDVTESNWYAAVARDLEATHRFSEIVLRDMPDPELARESIWLPFMAGELKCGPDTIVIGHSSGAIAGMRFLEQHKLAGLVLVAAYHTDLGMNSERLAGYFSRPFMWDRIRSNAGWIMQLHSSDDPFIPRSEADFVAERLHSDYTCYDDRSHFFSHNGVKHLANAIVAKLDAQ